MAGAEDVLNPGGEICYPPARPALQGTHGSMTWTWKEHLVLPLPEDQSRCSAAPWRPLWPTC